MDQAISVGAVITAGASRASTPDWVDLTPYDIPATPNPHFVSGGLCTLLEDTQIDLCGEERAWSYRRAEMIIAAAGAESAAEFNASFDPAYERLEIHALKVIRDGVVIDHRDTAFY